MRVVIQRVSSASVSVNEKIQSEIEQGLMVLVGIEEEDADEDIKWLSGKIVHLRIFDDEYKIPNISVKDNGGDILLISQFTLHASTKKGNRPGYSKAARPELAIMVYAKLIEQLEADLGRKIFTGTFGADMQVALLNDGPVTITIDSKRRE